MLPIIAAVALAVSISSTVVSLYSEGPLDAGQGGFDFCAIVRDEGILTSSGITNRGQQPLTLTSVYFPGSQGVRLLEAVVIPEHSGIGLMNYPLQGEDITDMLWDRRKPIDGYVLDAGAHVDLVLAAGLAPGQSKGLATEYDTDYVDAFGVSRSARAKDVTLYLQDGGDCPEDSDDWE